MKKVLSLIKLCCLSICLLHSFSACQKPADSMLIDKSFLTDQPCVAPCWYGLKLGSSTITQVVDTLEDLVFVDAASVLVLEGNNENQWVHFNCLDPGGNEKLQEEYCGIFMFDSSEKLVSMTLRLDYDLYLRQGLEKLKTPDGFTIVNSPDGCVMMLIWLSKKIGLSILIESGQDLSCSELSGGRLGDELLDWTIDWLSYSTIQPTQDELYPWSLEP